jgi:hypothetical protein
VLEREARELLDRLLAAYPLVSPPQASQETYLRFLRDLDVEVTAKVVDELIATSTTYPTIAHIRRRFFEISLEIPTPIGAWMSVVEGGQIHDLTRTVREFFGGDWGIKTSENPSITRAQFLRLYEELRDEALRDGNVRAFSRPSTPSGPSPAPAPDPIAELEEKVRDQFLALPESEREGRIAALGEWRPRLPVPVPDDVMPELQRHEAARRYGIEIGLLPSSESAAAAA